MSKGKVDDEMKEVFEGIDEDKLEEENRKNQSYESQFDEAEANGLVEEVSHSIHTWKDTGEKIVGVLKGFSAFEEGSLGDCLKYQIETSEGVISTVLGAVTDKYMENVKTGDLIRITYKGKKDLQDGRKVNLFKIEVSHIRD